jgi:zinc protease
VPAEELAKAKNYVALGFPGEFETNADVAGQYAELIVYGLPMDYYDAYVDKVLAVTAADVQRVAERHVTPDRVAVVVVGDRAVVGESLKALNLGPVALRAVDDVVR